MFMGPIKVLGGPHVACGLNVFFFFVFFRSIELDCFKDNKNSSSALTNPTAPLQGPQVRAGQGLGLSTGVPRIIPRLQWPNAVNRC